MHPWAKWSAYADGSSTNLYCALPSTTQGRSDVSPLSLFYGPAVADVFLQSSREVVAECHVESGLAPHPLLLFFLPSAQDARPNAYHQFLPFTPRVQRARRSCTEAPEKVCMFLLSNSQAGPGRNSPQPSTSLFHGLCTG